MLYHNKNQMSFKNNDMSEYCTCMFAQDESGLQLHLHREDVVLYEWNDRLVFTLIIFYVFSMLDW